MAQPSITPAAAVDAGCTATFSHIETIEPGDGSKTYRYEVSVSLAPGWKFRQAAKHQLATQYFRGTVTYTRNTFYYSSNPFNITEYEYYHNEDSYGSVVAESIEVELYYEAPPEQFAVTTAAFPANAGTTSGGGSFMSGDTCTVTAEENCSPWTFVRWDLSDGRMSRDRTFSFKVTGNVTCTASFSHTNTGVPYYEADGGGGILCASDGSILYDG